MPAEALPVVEVPSPSKLASAGWVALVSSATVSVEVLLTRLLSVASWYSLAFLILSLAMIGMAAGALAARRAQERGAPLSPWLADQFWRFAVSLVIALAAATAIPLRFQLSLSDVSAVLGLIVALGWPLATAGAILSRLLAESKVSVPVLYGVDLAAAALGALSPLVLLGPLSAQQGILVWALLIALGAAVQSQRLPQRRRVVLATPLALAALLVVTAIPGWGFEVRYPKGYEVDEQPIFERWNPLSLVSVGPFERDPEPFMWAPSPRMPHHPVQEANALIDGAAGTPVYAFKQLADLDDLRYDATTAAHSLRPDGTACVIGVGGGRDLITARLFGHDRVVGLEINPSMVAMLTALRSLNPILDDPHVEVRVGDGRALLQSSDLHCRVLQASLVDTWAATAVGAFAHAEGTLYTLEAWRLFLRSVEPDGILTFSRWYAPTRLAETTRLLSLAVGALLDRGVADPTRNLALVGAGHVATLLVSPSPFTATDLEKLHQLVAERDFRLIAAPDVMPADGLLQSVLRAHSLADLASAGDSLGFDSAPPTDDRPFFFQLARPKLFLHMGQLMDTPGVLSGNVVAMQFVVLTFVLALLFGAWLLAPELARSRELPGLRAVGYFAGLGAGFMIVEMSLVQRMHLVLGHPARSLIVVLAGLLAATGVGSLLSERLLTSPRRVGIAAAVTGLVLVVLPHAVIGPLADLTQGSSLAVRMLWCGGCAGATGLLLGLFFPAGIRYLKREAGVPAALAVNGFAAVLGSVAALVISVFWGISASMALAGALYFGAAAFGPATWRAPV